MSKEIIKDEWYDLLVEDCQAIITEAVFASRWALVEGYWYLGKRIREDSDKMPITKLLQRVGVDMGKSESTLWYAVQFYDKFPNINTLPEGKNISWRKVIELLPQPKREDIILPKGKYRVILADCPWKYGNMQHTTEEQKTTIDTHYPQMSIEELCEMKVIDLSAENAVLFMWVTSPFLEKVFEVIKAWGFEYKTSMIWDKVKHNVGYYVSVRHEILLICTKGSCLPDSNKLIDSVQTIERSDIHSQKPERFYEIIEEMYNGDYLELFSRKTRKGWKSFGNQINE